MKYVAVLKVDNDILLNGDLCVTTLQELYNALLEEDCTELEITREFANSNFTYTALCDFVENCAKIAPDKRVHVDGMFYSELSKAVSSLKKYQTTSELIFAMESNPTRFIACIQELCRHYQSTQDEALKASNQIASLQMHIKDMEDQLREKNDELDAAYLASNDTRAALKALVNRVNYRYEKTVNPDEMFLSGPNNYNHVLYIKEITRVHYMDTLLYYLQEILKTLYSVPVRFVVIEPYYSYGRAELYPECVPHWKLTYHDVYDGNIFMAGYQPKLMHDVLQNASHVQYLIVLDRCGYRVPHINGANVSHVYTASDLQDVTEEIEKDHIISYSEDTLYIPYIPDFDTMSLESKIQEYSSFNITKRLVQFLEEDA